MSDAFFTATPPCCRSIGSFFLFPFLPPRKTHRLSGSVATSAAPASPSAPRPTTAVLMPPAATAASPKSPKAPRGGAGPRGAADARRAAGCAARDETARAVLPALGVDVRLPRIVAVFFLKPKKKSARVQREEQAGNL